MCLPPTNISKTSSSPFTTATAANSRNWISLSRSCTHHFPSTHLISPKSWPPSNINSENPLSTDPHHHAPGAISLISSRPPECVPKQEPSFILGWLLKGGASVPASRFGTGQVLAK